MVCYFMIIVCFILIEATASTDVFQSTHNKRKIFFVLCISTAIFLFFSSLTLFVIIKFGVQSSTVIKFAKTMGWISSAIVVVQWIPQIIVTHKNKASGALSVHMMVLYASFSFFTFFYLMILMQQDISSYISYLIGALQQTFICIMCFYFDFVAVKSVTTSV